MTQGMTNGFSIRSWSDLSSVILFVSFIVSGLVWGMKLEERQDIIREELLEIRAEIGRGILPRADERIIELQRRIEELEEELEES
jgi:hypothetical protein